jgi:hypothetical protein
VIHIIITLRANLIHKEIEGVVQGIVGARNIIRVWDVPISPATPNMFKVDRMMRRLERIRRQRWAPWKDKK